ncbi:MAG: VanZ family protein [bacterium]
MCNVRCSSWFLVTVCIVIVIGILILGLHPKDFSNANNTRWILQPNGISFGKYGMAYTDPSIELFPSDISNNSKNAGFSIEMALKSAHCHDTDFSIILSLHNGDDKTQFIIGQWREWIIVMNGDDYAHKRKTKRISVNTASLCSKILFITLISDKDSTKFYMEGQLMSEKKSFSLKMPDGTRKARLIIGNSIYGRQSWRGDIYGLALYDYILTKDQIIGHYTQWSDERNFSFAQMENPYTLYLFEKTNSTRFIDYGYGKNHLHIPKSTKVFKCQILTSPFHYLTVNGNFIEDSILNLFGFVPLGFFLMIAFMRFSNSHKTYGLFLVVSFGFLLSLFIECSQSMIPSRSSSLLDLILNTIGTLIGVLMYRLFIFSKQYFYEDKTL